MAIELRAVNNRYLKVTLRAAEPYNLLEPEFEKVVRRTVKRGTIQVHLRCQRQFAAQDFQINAVALQLPQSVAAITDELALADDGRRCCRRCWRCRAWCRSPPPLRFNLEEEWPVLERVLEQALARLQAMRLEEGRAMAQELLQLRDHIAAQLEKIRAAGAAGGRSLSRSLARTSAAAAE